MGIDYINGAYYGMPPPIRGIRWKGYDSLRRMRLQEVHHFRVGERGGGRLGALKQCLPEGA